MTHFSHDNNDWTQLDSRHSAEINPQPTPYTNAAWPTRQQPFDWSETLRHGINVDQVAAEIGQESQARIAIVGLPNVGKRHLYNKLRGWPIDWNQSGEEAQTQPVVEQMGLFVLADLPDPATCTQPSQAGATESLLFSLGGPALIVYMLDSALGVTQADYRWLAAVRASGVPLVLALNHQTKQVHDSAQVIEQKLSLEVVPISTRSGLNIETKLLPALIKIAPRLAIPLAREVKSLRRTAARRVIRQTALLTMLISAQPVPGLELPFLALTHVGLTMRIAAAYGKQQSGGLRLDTVATIGSVMVAQYAIQTVIKTVPLLGSFVAGVLSGLATLLIGELAIWFYSGAKLKLRRPRFPRFRPNPATAQTVVDQQARQQPIQHNHVSINGVSHD